MQSVHIPIQAIKGGGIAHLSRTVERHARESVDDAGALDEQREARDAAPRRPPSALGDCKSAITPTTRPTWGSRSASTLRGCEHGLRVLLRAPSHSYLKLSPGPISETRLIAKRTSLKCCSASWKPRHLPVAGHRT